MAVKPMMATPGLLHHPDTQCAVKGCRQHGLHVFGLAELRRFCADHRQVGADWWAGIVDATPAGKPALAPSAAIKQGRLL